jgi:NADH-quinone oxidoreductase subunit N
MNYALLSLEIAVVLTGLAVLLADLWLPAGRKPALGYAAAAVLGGVLLLSFSQWIDADQASTAFGGMYLQDELSLFFKRFFLIAAIVVLIMSVDFADRFPSGIGEYYALCLFALAGMMLAASASDFSLLFVAVELITVSFYILTSFQRTRVLSLEAGVKYLILGALASAILVYGIALVCGIAGTMNFAELARVAPGYADSRLFQVGLLLILAGLGFKIAVFPLQLWVPDVYQGAPTPTTAFLAVGSKAAGFVLLLRVLFSAVPDLTFGASRLFMALAALTILYGNLCAIPQRNLKRLLGYSSISNAGYLLLGVAALSRAGQSAILFYLGAYLATVLAAFLVISVVSRELNSEDITSLAGLNRRSPLLAAGLTLAMVSLAGIPPLAGFFGKFLLLKAVIEQAHYDPAYWWLLGITLAGIVISLYYYFGVVRAIYWPSQVETAPPIAVARPVRLALVACAAAVLVLGLFPGGLLHAAAAAVQALGVGL